MLVTTLAGNPADLRARCALRALAAQGSKSAAWSMIAPAPDLASEGGAAVRHGSPCMAWQQPAFPRPRRSRPPPGGPAFGEVASIIAVVYALPRGAACRWPSRSRAEARLRRSISCWCARSARRASQGSRSARWSRAIRPNFVVNEDIRLSASGADDAFLERARIRRADRGAGAAATLYLGGRRRIDPRDRTAIIVDDARNRDRRDGPGGARGHPQLGATLVPCWPCRWRRWVIVARWRPGRRGVCLEPASAYGRRRLLRRFPPAERRRDDRPARLKARSRTHRNRTSVDLPRAQTCARTRAGCRIASRRPAARDNEQMYHRRRDGDRWISTQPARWLPIAHGPGELTSAERGSRSRVAEANPGLAAADRPGAMQNGVGTMTDADDATSPERRSARWGTWPEALRRADDARACFPAEKAVGLLLPRRRRGGQRRAGERSATSTGNMLHRTRTLMLRGNVTSLAPKVAGA